MGLDCWSTKELARVVSKKTDGLIGRWKIRVRSKLLAFAQASKAKPDVVATAD